jgi:MFS family permease
LQVVLAMLVMPTLGWRWLLALSSIPSLCFLLVCAWLPESPRYMAASGHSDQATNQPITARRLFKKPNQ